MLISTRGIVFKFTKFRETSIITHIYTEALGLNTYIANSVRSVKSKFNIGYFEPLSLVEISGYHKPNREIDRLSEIKSAYPTHNIGKDIYKSTISVFLAEVLNKCIIEKDKNPGLFDFLFNAIITLNNSDQSNSFHLHFMIKLAQYLGFGIHDPKALNNQASHSEIFENSNNVRLIQKLIESDLSAKVIIPVEIRSTLLDEIIYYYQIQMDMPKLKSLEVLHTVFN